MHQSFSDLVMNFDRIKRFRRRLYVMEWKQGLAHKVIMMNLQVNKTI